MNDINENTKEQGDFLVEDVNLDELSDNLVAELEDSFKDIELLKKEREKIENPEALTQVIKDEVLKQFSNQLGFSLTEESLVEKYDRENPESYAESKIGNKARGDSRYIKENKANKQSQEKGTLTDAYTGKKFALNDKQNLDHVVPIKEIFDNLRRKQANADVVSLANKKENFAATNESLNKAKRDTSNKEFVKNRSEFEAKWQKKYEKEIEKIEKSHLSEADKNAQRRKQNKRYENKMSADDSLMLEKDRNARKALQKDINKDASVNISKKVGLDALKQVAIQGLMDLLKQIMAGLVKFFKSKKKSFKVLLSDMKESIRRFLSNIMSLVKTGTSSFIGTILSEIFGPIVGIFKKMASFIKQGILSVIDAVKYLTNPDNKEKSFSEKVSQVGKILVATITGGAAIALGGIFEGALMNVPIFAIQIPIIGTLANVVGVFLSSLLSGVVGAIIINLIDKWLADKQKKEIGTKLVSNQNKILITQNQQLAVEGAASERAQHESMNNIANRHENANIQIGNIISNMAKKESNSNTRRSVNSVHDDAFQKMSNDLDNLL